MLISFFVCYTIATLGVTGVMRLQNRVIIQLYSAALSFLLLQIFKTAVLKVPSHMIPLETKLDKEETAVNTLVTTAVDTPPEIVVDMPTIDVLVPEAFESKEEDIAVGPEVEEAAVILEDAVKVMDLDDDDLACQPLDIHKKFGFADYRSPNEDCPKNARPHLEKMDKGWIVSTGTQRSFFDLILAPEALCEGLIIRDINPKVKGYCDFLILLLRITKSRGEFMAFYNYHDPEAFRNLLFPRIAQAEMSEKMKKYYTDNFDNLMKCYLDVDHFPLLNDYSEVDYRKDDALFNKLQKYARAGKIIATEGDINDLRFAGNRKIVLIDFSNIPDYILINPLWNGDHPCRIVHTLQCTSRFFSGMHHQIDGFLKEKMDRLFAAPPFSKAIKIPRLCRELIDFAKIIGIIKDDEDNCLPKSLYSEQNFTRLTELLIHPSIPAWFINQQLESE